MNIREILDLMEDIEDSEPSIGDVVEMECGDTLIETTIADITEDGVVLHIDEAGIRILVDGAQALLEGKTGPGLWANIHAKRERIKHGSGERMRKPGSKGAPTADNFRSAQAGTKNEGVEDVAEAGNQSPHAKLALLKKKYEEILKSPNPNITRLRKIRDDIVKLEFDLGIKEGVAEGEVGEYPNNELGRAQEYFKDNADADMDFQEIVDMLVDADFSEEIAKDIARDAGREDDLEEAKYQGREVPLGKPMKGDVKKSKVYVKGPKGNVVKVNFGDKNMRIKKSIPGRRKSFRARHNCDNPGPRWKARYWSCRAW